MATIKTEAYDIIIENGSFTRLKSELETLTYGTLFFIIDAKVYKLHYEKITRIIQTLAAKIILVPHGEQSKSFETYRQVIAKLLDKGIKRDDLLIALGGGVSGDLTGFIAATLYRGIRFIQVPTTLLSMVDSSIGGKTAINLPEGKNLIGAFYMPKKVLIDPLFLKTLPDKEYKSGLSETYKAALLQDATLLQKLKAGHPIDETIIKQAIDVKKAIVAQDPLDEGYRHILNFGHTFAHAIERRYNFKDITHGEAVAEGMIMALKIGVKFNQTPRGLMEAIEQLFLEKDLVAKPLLDYRDFLHEIKTDKKMVQDGLNFVFLSDYQKPLIKKIDLRDLS